MHLSVTPILPLKEERRADPELKAPKSIDTKVKGLVLELIGQARGALLPSAMAPQIVSLLFPGFEAGRMDVLQKKKRRSPRKSPIPRKAPIGLMPVDSEGWVNALMQFILYVPGFAESFDFAPKSLSSMQEFLDQYHQDIAEGKTVSTANGDVLFRLFTYRLPSLSLLDIFASLIHLLKPKWELFKSYSEALKNAKTGDLFLALNILKKQLFVEPNQYYDLDAFIEKRPDGRKVNYIAYVKIDGCWYQCDETRVTQLRSDTLGLSLQRSILAHYKKVF